MGGTSIDRPQADLEPSYDVTLNELLVVVPHTPELLHHARHSGLFKLLAQWANRVEARSERC